MTRSWFVLVFLPLTTAGCDRAQRATPSREGSAEAAPIGSAPVGSPPPQPVGSPPSGPSSAPASAVPPSTPPRAALGSLEPSPLRTSGVRAARAVEDFNRWATKANLREDLAALVALGRPVTPDTHVSIDVRYTKGESPSSATVTVIEDGYRDDSLRGQKLVFRFSRQPCATCSTGWSGWWLGSIDVSQRCWEGRGHTDFGKELCN